MEMEVSVHVPNVVRMVLLNVPRATNTRPFHAPSDVFEAKCVANFLAEDAPGIIVPVPVFRLVEKRPTTYEVTTTISGRDESARQVRVIEELIVDADLPVENVILACDGFAIPLIQSAGRRVAIVTIIPIDSEGDAKIDGISRSVVMIIPHRISERRGSHQNICRE